MTIGRWWRILALVLHHDERAVELALDEGVPSKTHILNRLHGLIDGKPAAPTVVTTPHVDGCADRAYLARSA